MQGLYSRRWDDGIDKRSHNRQDVPEEVAQLCIFLYSGLQETCRKIANRDQNGVHNISALHCMYRHSMRHLVILPATLNTLANNDATLLPPSCIGKKVFLFQVATTLRTHVAENLTNFQPDIRQKWQPDKFSPDQSTTMGCRIQACPATMSRKWLSSDASGLWPGCGASPSF